MAKRWKYCKQIPCQVDIPNKSLLDLFSESVEKNHEKPFLYFKGRTKNYAEVDLEVRKFGNALIDLGVKKGDRIALLMPNCPQFIVSYLGALSIGAIITAISPLYTAKEIGHQLRDSGSILIVTMDNFLDKVRAIRESTNLKEVIVTSAADELSPLTGFIYKKFINRKAPKVKVGQERHYKNVLKNGAEKPIKTKIDPENDLVCLQYTGGTTGVPKGAMLTHKNLVSQAVVLDYWEWWIGGPIDEQGKSIGVLPFSHIFGLTSSFFWPMYAGQLIALIPDPRQFEEILSTIEKLKIHFMFAVPTLFQKLAEYPKIKKYDLTSLRSSISGGASLHPEINKSFEEATGTLLFEGFGLSESSPVTHINPADINLRRRGIGIPVPNTDAKIVSITTNEDLFDFDTESGYTSEGELWVKGPQVMKGYWNKPEETAKVLTDDGWLRTGDVARMSKDGYFVIVDRLKDCIFASGFQVWPLEVETALCNHPDISRAVVIGVRTDQDNEIVKAVLVPSEGSPQLSKEELRAYCKKELAPYKVPRIFEYRDEVPLSPVGKILRRPLKEEAKNAVIKTKQL
jgi:long-chain acyl-CoA synthetase